MAILLLILLALAAVTGVLWVAVKVALGVALGLFLAFLAVATYVQWRMRRMLFGQGRGRWRRVRGSKVTVLYRQD